MKKIFLGLALLFGGIQAQAASGTGGTGGVAINFIQDEGSAVTQRNILNFIGGGVTCIDNAGQIRTDCTISGSGSGGASALEVFSNFDAVRSSPTASISLGDGLKLTVSGSTAIVNVDFSSVTSRSDVILNQASLQSGSQFHVSSGSVKGQLLIYGGSIQTILLPSTTEAMRLVNISSHQVFMVIKSSGTNYWRIGSDVTGLAGVPSYDIYNSTTGVKDISISTSDVMTINATAAFPGLTASRPLKLNSTGKVISNLIDLTSDVTNTLPSANLPTNVAYTNVNQTFSGSNVFTGSQTFSGGLAVSTLSSGECVETTTGGLLTTSGAPCGSGGGGGSSTLSVGTGTLTNFTTKITSPTAAVSFLGSQFKSLALGTTNVIQLNQSSVTVQGVLKAGSNITLTPGSGTLTISSTGGSGGASVNVSPNSVLFSTGGTTISGDTGFQYDSSVSSVTIAGALKTGEIASINSSGIQPLSIISQTIGFGSGSEIGFYTNSGSLNGTFGYDSLNNYYGWKDSSAVRMSGARRAFFPDRSTFQIYNVGGTSYVSFRSSDTTTTQDLVFPASEGTAGQVLTIDNIQPASGGNDRLTNLKWNTPSSGGGGGASSLAVGTGTLTSFTNNISSPTSAISALGSQFSVLSLGTTAIFQLNPDTVTVNRILVSTLTVDSNATFNNVGSFIIGASSMTFAVGTYLNLDYVTAGQCLQTDSTGKVTSSGSTCGGSGGGGASSLEVFNNFDGTRSSPTASIGMSNAFRGTVVGSTYTFSLNSSSVTLGGVITAGSGITITPGSGITTITATGGGGSSSLAVGTGTVNGLVSTTTANTSAIDFEAAQFNSRALGTTTNYISLNQSSVTLQGVLVAGSNITISPSGGITTISAPTAGSGLANVGRNGTYLVGPITNLNFDGTGFGLSESPAGTAFVTNTVSGGGTSSLAVGTGTASNFTNSITSPTAAISFLGEQFKSVAIGTTNFIYLNSSSVTLKGQDVASLSSIQTFSELNTFSKTVTTSKGIATTTMTASGDVIANGDIHASGSNGLFIGFTGNEVYASVTNHSFGELLVSTAIGILGTSTGQGQLRFHDKNNQIGTVIKSSDTVGTPYSIVLPGSIGSAGQVPTISNIVGTSAYLNFQTPSAGGSGDLVSTLVNAETIIGATTTLTSGAYAHTYVATGTTHDYPITLPDAASHAGEFIEIRIATSCTRAITISTGAVSNSIDGRPTRIMFAGESCLLKSDGVGFNKIAGKTIPQYARANRSSTDITGLAGSVWNNLVMDTFVEGNSLMWDSTNGRIKIKRQAQYTVSVFWYGSGFTQFGYVGSVQNLETASAGPKIFFGSSVTPGTVVAGTQFFQYSANVGDFFAAVEYGDAVGTITIFGATVPATIVVTEIPQW